MDLRQLEIFRAVMDTGSATAAARLLQLSQPAVSRQLARIEAELGLDLFVRGGGRLKPTGHALALHDEVNHAFEGIERVLNLASRMRGQDSGVLRVGAPTSFGERLLPRVLAELSARHPQLRFTAEFGRYDDIAARIASRQIDLGLLKAPLNHPGLRQHALLDCGMACLLPTGHALARLARIPVAALCREPLVLLGRDTLWRSDLQALFRSAPRMPSVRIETRAASAACAFVRHGLGVSVLPTFLAAQFATPGLVLRPFDAPLRHRFVVGTPTGLRHASLLDEFIHLARADAQQLMADALPDGD